MLSKAAVCSTLVALATVSAAAQAAAQRRLQPHRRPTSWPPAT